MKELHELTKAKCKWIKSGDKVLIRATDFPFQNCLKSV